MAADSRPPSVLASQPRPDRAFDRTFAPGTLLDSETGWRPVETLRAGEHVRTLHGMSRIARLSRQPPDRSRLHWRIPAGKLGTCCDLRLNAGQCIVIMAPACTELFDHPLVLVPVPATTGFCGVHTVSGFALRSGIALGFDADEIVFAQTGALIHVPGPEPAPPGHPVLSYRDSRRLLARLCREDRQAGADSHTAGNVA